jgi:hypothetical protein
MDAVEAEMRRAAQVLEHTQANGVQAIDAEMKRAQASSETLASDATISPSQNGHQIQLRRICPELFDNADLNELAAAIAPPSPNIITGQGTRADHLNVRNYEPPGYDPHESKMIEEAEVTVAVTAKLSFSGRAKHICVRNAVCRSCNLLAHVYL